MISALYGNELNALSEVFKCTMKYINMMCDQAVHHMSILRMHIKYHEQNFDSKSVSYLFNQQFY